MVFQKLLAIHWFFYWAVHFTVSMVESEFFECQKILITLIIIVISTVMLKSVIVSFESLSEYYNLISGSS